MCYLWWPSRYVLNYKDWTSWEKSILHLFPSDRWEKEWMKFLFFFPQWYFLLSVLYLQAQQLINHRHKDTLWSKCLSNLPHQIKGNSHVHSKIHIFYQLFSKIHSFPNHICSKGQGFQGLRTKRALSTEEFLSSSDFLW